MKHNVKLYAHMRGQGYITITEAMERAQLPRSTLYDAMLQGTIESTKVGKRKFLKESSLLVFLGPVAAELYRKTPPPADVMPEPEPVAAPVVEKAKRGRGRATAG